MNRLTRNVLDDDPLLTSSEVAALFRVCRRTIGLWAKAGRLPSTMTPGGQRRYRRSVIAALLEDGES